MLLLQVPGRKRGLEVSFFPIMRLFVRDSVKFSKLREIREPSLLLCHDVHLYFTKIPFLTVSRSAIGNDDD